MVRVVGTVCCCTIVVGTNTVVALPVRVIRSGATCAVLTRVFVSVCVRVIGVPLKVIVSHDVVFSVTVVGFTEIDVTVWSSARVLIKVVVNILVVPLAEIVICCVSVVQEVVVLVTSCWIVVGIIEVTVWSTTLVEFAVSWTISVLVA